MSTITSKGQVTLPKPLRDRMGLKPGSEVSFSLNTAGEIVVKPMQKQARQSAQKAASEYREILESLAGTADKRFASTDDFMQFVRG